MRPRLKSFGPSLRDRHRDQTFLASTDNIDSETENLFLNRWDWCRDKWHMVSSFETKTKMSLKRQNQDVKAKKLVMGHNCVIYYRNNSKWESRFSRLRLLKVSFRFWDWGLRSLSFKTKTDIRKLLIVESKTKIWTIFETETTQDRLLDVETKAKRLADIWSESPYRLNTTSMRESA